MSALELCARARRGAASSVQDAASVPSTMFSSTRQVLGEREVLVHHADAGIERGCGEPGGSGEAAVGAGDLDRALVGDVVAEEDVHQRRLAGAVLAEQREDLARGAGRRSIASLATSAPKRFVTPGERAG